jgi:hypothetical protein
MRDLIFVAQPDVLSRPHFLGVGPSIRSKSTIIFLRDLAHPPFYIQWALGCREYTSWFMGMPTI